MTVASTFWRDAALPELSIALRPAELANWLADADGDCRSPEGAAGTHRRAQRLDALLPELRSARIASARYKPGDRCMVCYCSQGHSARPLALLGLYGVAYARRASRGYRDAVAVPALRGLLWLFPADRKLPTLPQLSDPAHAVAACARLAYRPPRAHVPADVQPMHYLPEQSYTLRIRDGSGNDVYGKCRYDDRARTTLSRLESLRHAEGFVVPTPLGYDPATHSAWQTGIAGARTATFAEVAPALSALHRQSIATGELPASNGHGARLSRTLRLLSTSFPELSARLHRPIAILERRLDQLDVRAGLLHGDVHPGNFFATGDGDEARVAFIDLDDLHVGDVRDELGSLVAHAIHRSLLETSTCQQTTAARASAVANALRIFDSVVAELQDYRAPDGRRVDLHAMRTHTVMALLTERATRAVTRLKLPSPAYLDCLLEIADALIDA